MKKNLILPKKLAKKKKVPMHFVTDNMKKLRKQEISELINILSDAYNCDLEFIRKYYFYVNPKGKIYISNVDIVNFKIVTRISNFGLYFGTLTDDGKVRLSIEGTSFINPKKNYVKLKKEVLASYLAAENLFEEDIEEKNVDNSYPFLIVIFEGDNLGCVSKKEKYYINYLSKSRKLDYNKVF
jgi:ribosome biogenesis protein Nip4